MDRDDQALVQACLAGDQQACTELVDTFARMVGTVIWRATGDRAIVEDLAQETFLRTFKALRYFDARARLSTWIYTIAHNVAVDYLRRSSAAPTGPLIRSAVDRDDGDAQWEGVSAYPDPEAQLSTAEAERLVHEALATLPLKYRLPILYSAIDGLDYPTIASMLGVPLGTVKTMIFRGKRMLKGEISRRLQVPDGH